MAKVDELRMFIGGKEFFPAGKDFSVNIPTLGGPKRIDFTILEDKTPERVADLMNKWFTDNHMKFSFCFPKDYSFVEYVEKDK